MMSFLNIVPEMDERRSRRPCLSSSHFLEEGGVETDWMSYAVWDSTTQPLAPVSGWIRCHPCLSKTCHGVSSFRSAVIL